MEVRTMAEKANIFDTITDMFITAIEAGWVNGNKWVRPWAISASAPTNPTTGREYNGLNRLVMMVMGVTYAAGYGQWNKAGAQVRKGSKAIPITIPMMGKDKQTGDTVCFGFKGGMVFPSMMVDGWEAPAPKPPAFDRDDVLEAFITDTGAVIAYGGDTAAHYPGTNSITMPHHAAFDSKEDYYGTILHELVHWTNVKDRLNRRQSHLDRFSTMRDAYAFEELVAELGASFLCADLGVHPGFRQDHGEYIAHWLGILKGDSKAIWTAATQAQAAVKYIHEQVDAARQKAAAA